MGDPGGPRRRLGVCLLLAATAGPAALAAAAADAPAGAGMELYGTVLVEGGDSFAFIHDGSPRGKVQKLRVGQRIGGATVGAIRADRVVIVVAGAEVELDLRSHKASLPVVGLLNEGVSVSPEPGGGQRGEVVVPAEGSAEVSPRPAQLTDTPAPLIRRQQRYPERPPSSDPPWRPPAPPPRQRPDAREGGTGPQ